LATKAPIVVAPAMNVNMYEHPQTQENLATLRNRGVEIVEPESGALACGWQGRGRLASPYQIYAYTERAIASRDLIGLRVLITAGPTREALDPVRYLSNRSSGKMGIALAREAFKRGASVTFVHGPLTGPSALPAAVRCIPVVSAEDMHSAVIGGVYQRDGSLGYDVVVMAAAVADYRPVSVAPQKIKKGTGSPCLELAANPDIVSTLGAKRGGLDAPVLVGFAVETGTTEELIAEAKRKLERKNLDIVVGNLASDSFDKDTNRVCIVSRNGLVRHVDTAAKRRVACKVWNSIAESLAKQGKIVQSLAQ
jgi:phosphopantothenoylcysteine decarboxylase/phosphopantothenate--cysteine ligase